VDSIFISIVGLDSFPFKAGEIEIKIGKVLIPCGR